MGWEFSLLASLLLHALLAAFIFDAKKEDAEKRAAQAERDARDREFL